MNKCRIGLLAHIQPASPVVLAFVKSELCRFQPVTCEIKRKELDRLRRDWYDCLSLLYLVHSARRLPYLYKASSVTAPARPRGGKQLPVLAAAEIIALDDCRTAH